MFVSAGVGGVATVLPVVEPLVQSHYYLDQRCISQLIWYVICESA